MKDCLLTTLKGSINNDNLPLFDTIILPLKAFTDTDSANNHRISLGFVSNGDGKGITIKVDGDGYFVLDDFSHLSDPEYQLKSYTITSGHNKVYFANVDCNVYISKYNLEYIWDYSKMTYTPVDIKEFGYSNLTKFIYRTLTGSIEDFVALQIEAGFTVRNSSNPVETNALSAGVTFGGETHAAGTGFLTWESESKIIYYRGTSIADSTEVYAKGATAEEITAWENAGKTVVVIS